VADRSDLRNGDASGEWSVRATGGPRLHGRSWRPAGQARAAILIVPGLAEHSGRYVATAAALVASGYAVHALDYRGHGTSEGPRVHVDDVAEYVADVRAGIDEVRGQDGGRPLFLLGHSQGALIVLALALADPEGLDGLVLISPFLAVHPASRPSAAVRAMAGILLRIAPRRPLPTRIDVDLLARDPEVGRAYARDPLVSHAASAGWLRAIQKAQKDVRTGAGRLRVPALVMAAGDDRLVDPEAARAFAEAAPRDLVDFVWWDGHRHEVLNDTGREAVIARVVEWLDRRIRTLSG
jgi:alpha-beta hydrolase superfamily lysophospholipase